VDPWQKVYSTLLFAQVMDALQSSAHDNKGAEVKTGKGRAVAGMPQHRAGVKQRRGGGLRRMPDLLGHILDPAARQRGMAEARLLTHWVAVVGQDLAARCYPIRLTAGGLLHLHVSGSAAVEVQHSELQLIERINGYFGGRPVARLRLLQAPMRRECLPAPKPPVPALSEEAQAVIQDMVRSVDDEPLRHALAILGGTLHRVRR
jgi:hypothetical protein